MVGEEEESEKRQKGKRTTGTFDRNGENIRGEKVGLEGAGEVMGAETFLLF